MEVIVSKGRLLTYKIHIAADLKFTFRNERNNFHRIWNEVIHSSEAAVLDSSIRDEPQPERPAGAGDDWRKI